MGRSLAMVVFCFLFVYIDVDGGFEGPPWRPDVRVDGFDFAHVFGEVLCNVPKVGEKGHASRAVLACFLDPFV